MSMNMGRSEAIPKSFFAKLHSKRGIPANNVILVGVLALAGALCDMLREPFRISYEKGAEMLNFGAFIAFMGVNIAAFFRYFLRAERKTAWTFAWCAARCRNPDCPQNPDTRFRRHRFRGAFFPVLQ